MIKSGIDQQALIAQFASASAQHTEQLRQGVYQATLGALQGRELSLKNIRSVLASVTQAASAGVAKNPLAGLDAGSLLDQAVQGMDDALLKAVEANKLALQQLVDRGADLRNTQLKKALGDLDKFEDTLFAAVQKSAGAVGDPMAGPWAEVMAKLVPGATQTGSRAAGAAEQLTGQLAQVQTALRASRAASLQAVQTLTDSYAALVSGVLIGLSDAMRQAGGSGGKPRK